MPCDSGLRTRTSRTCVAFFGAVQKYWLAIEPQAPSVVCLDGFLLGPDIALANHGLVWLPPGSPEAHAGWEKATRSGWIWRLCSLSRVAPDVAPK